MIDCVNCECQLTHGVQARSVDLDRVRSYLGQGACLPALPCLHRYTCLLLVLTPPPSLPSPSMHLLLLPTPYPSIPICKLPSHSSLSLSISPLFLYSPPLPSAFIPFPLQSPTPSQQPLVHRKSQPAPPKHIRNSTHAHTTLSHILL